MPLLASAACGKILGMGGDDQVDPPVSLLSSPGIISRREQFLSLKNHIRLDGQGIKTSSTNYMNNKISF
jgi:hypothetical protein